MSNEITIVVYDQDSMDSECVVIPATEDRNVIWYHAVCWYFKDNYEGILDYFKKRFEHFGGDFDKAAEDVDILDLYVIAIFPGRQEDISERLLGKEEDPKLKGKFADKEDDEDAPD
jgi:hypothetical protein